MFFSGQHQLGTNRLQRFFSNLAKVHAQPHSAANEAETEATLTAVFSEFGTRRAVLGRVPDRVKLCVERASAGIELADLERLDRRASLEALKEADTGITWAENAVEDCGALVEIAYDDVHRLASSLPLNHVSLISSGSLLPSLGIAMERVGDVIRSQAKKPAVSFISGPSKTGDIEMRLLYGVHGPNKLHVVSLDWI